MVQAMPRRRGLAVLRDFAADDLRHAWRGLRRSPGFTAIVTATLALGIGANAAMFGILDRLLFRAPEHVADPDRLVQIHTRWLGSDVVQSSQSYRFHKDLIEAVPSFSSVAVATTASPYPLGRGESAGRIAGVQVTPSFFPTLGVSPHVGRFFQEDEAGETNPRKVAVVGYDFWQSHFGGRPDVISQTLDIGADRYTVVGVAPRGFTGAELATVDVWIPIAAADGLRFEKGPEWRTTSSSTWLRVYARLKDGASMDRALVEAAQGYRTYLNLRSQDPNHPARADSGRVLFGSVIPGKSLGRSGLSATSPVVRVARLLGVVSLMVLLLACANVANLLLVRALARRREIAVRLALGISRRRLAGQLMLEGLLLALLGAAGALAIVVIASGGLRRLLLAEWTWSGSAVDGRVLMVTGTATIVTALIVSVLPIAQFTNPELTTALKSGVREGRADSRSRTRAGLLMVQTALALVLLAGAGLFVRSLQRVAELPFGVDMDRVVLASIEHGTVGLSTAEAKRLYLQFMERARAVPGVSAAAVSIAHSFGLGWGTRVTYRGERLQLPQQGFAQYAITPDYFTVMGIRLVGGRAFSDDDREGSAPVVVINETAARSFWPAGDAIGQCIVVGADTMPCATIVGIVTNSRRQQLMEGPIPQLYRPLLQLPIPLYEATVSNFGFTLLARSERPAAVVEPLRRAIQSTSASVPFAHVRTLSDQFGGRHTRAWTLGASMFSIFGGLALVIAAVGLFSVVTFTMAQRTHEYGVRLALGASESHLVWITMLRGLVPATLGLLLGAALSMAAGKLVASLLFETAPYDPVVFGSISALLLATAAVACLLPGLRAARTDPAVVLRSE